LAGRDQGGDVACDVANGRLERAGSRPQRAPQLGSLLRGLAEDIAHYRPGLVLQERHESLLLAQGVHARVVMETLRHSQISLTISTYSHVIPALGRDAADRMEAVLAGG